MIIRKLPLIAGIMLCLTLMGCATFENKPEKVIIPVQAQHPSDVMQIQFIKVKMEGISMEDAINELDKYIRISKYGYQFNDEFSSDHFNKTNPIISVNMKNVTMREVLNALCTQSKWHYNDKSAFIVFFSN